MYVVSTNNFDTPLTQQIIARLKGKTTAENILIQFFSVAILPRLGLKIYRKSHSYSFRYRLRLNHNRIKKYAEIF